jgi:hypothetical protein
MHPTGEIMKSLTVRKGVFVISLSVFATSIVSFAVFSKSTSQQPEKKNPRTYQAAQVTAAPQVISKIKGLQITSVTLINQGQPEAAVAIDVTNNRDEAVMALDFVSGRGTSSGLGIDGLLLEGESQTIIPPHTLKTFQWSLGEIMEGHPVILAAAIFADGKEEGDKRSLNGIKVHRKHFQQRQRDAKVGNGGQN